MAAECPTYSSRTAASSEKASLLLRDLLGGHQSGVGQLGEQRLRACGKLAQLGGDLGYRLARRLLRRLRVAPGSHSCALLAASQGSTAADSAPGRTGEPHVAEQIAGTTRG